MGCWLAWSRLLEREANAAAADSSKTGAQGGSRAGHTSTGLDSVLGSHCCISGASDALGEPTLQYFLRVRDREPLFLSLALLHSPVVLLYQISHVICGSLKSPAPSAIHSHRSLSPFVFTPHFIHIVSTGVHSLFPEEMWELFFFNLRCRYSLIVPCVLH